MDHLFEWRLYTIPWPIFQCIKTNSEGCGGGDKEYSSRWFRRLELQYTRGKTERSGGYQGCDPWDRHSNWAHCYHGDRSHGHCHDNAGDESPTSGKQGCPERRVDGMSEKQMRRTKGASRSRDSRIRCVRGGGWRGQKVGEGKMKDAEQKGKKNGWQRERLCLLNVGAASRADADAGRKRSRSKPKPLTHTLQ